MKKIIQIVLALAIIALAYVLYMQFATPLRFQRVMKTRQEAVIERIKDIRTAERAYKQNNGAYTGDFDSLINFILTDSIQYEKQIVSMDDSVGLALLKKAGRKNIETFEVAVIDTLFGDRKLTVEQVKNLRVIPHSNGQEFILAATNLLTESKVGVPVFECKAPFKTFLADLDEQELVNLIDQQKALERYPGIKCGSLTQATNDAGNWE